MQHTPVTSSFITSVGHEGDTLEITLKTGKTLRLKGVGAEHHAGMQAADSPGRYFATHLRGKFDTETIEPVDTVL